jgi:hypothetical protein
MSKWFWAVIFACAIVTMATGVRAGEPAINPPLRAGEAEKDWSVELGSGVLLADVRTDNTGYTLVPVDLTASYAVDEVSLDDVWGGVLRGNTDFLFRSANQIVVYGIESRFIGAGFGPRYNFVQPGWKIVPFVEGTVGFAFTNSRGRTRPVSGDVGQGQDFCFNFGVAAGFRYDITEDWFARLSAVYTHYSNGGLSEPERKNHGLDAMGPEVSVGCKF